MKLKFLKRPFDLTLSILLFVIGLPIIIVTAGLIILIMGRPILFTQERIGKDLKPFLVYKFRTMYNFDPNYPDATDEERTPFLGHMLRKLSVDELPQFINVIKNEMSLIGPRPLPIESLKEYLPEKHCRHKVLPGISGLAQVEGRNTVNFADRFKLDDQYVMNQNFALDLKIFFKTIYKIFLQEGIDFPKKTVEEHAKHLTKETCNQKR